LAKASDIEAAIDGATVMPDRTRHLAFGDVATVWEMLWRLRVPEMIDRWLQLLAGALRSRRLRPETLRQTESQVLLTDTAKTTFQLGKWPSITG
jgi:hypothetical protein